MNKPPINMCSVYLLGDGSIVVEGVDYEPTGPGGLSSNVRVRLASEATSVLLGEVVLAVLDQTKIVDGALHDGKQIMAGLLSLTGTKSWKSFAANAKCLLVRMKDQHVEVVPTAYTSEHGGWYNNLPDQAGRCEPRPDNVRDLLLAKIAECR